MQTRVTTSLIAAILLAAGQFAAVAGPDDWQSCITSEGDAIAACTRLIATHELDVSRLATVYQNRAAARQRRGDVHGAIADLDQAISLDPRIAIAY